MRPTISIGSRSEDVRFLQQTLRDVYGFALGADGIFGRLTREAVFQFQHLKALAVDGVVGPKTWAALSSGEAAEQPPLPDDEYLRAVVLFAESLVGTREDPPESNRGPVVDKIIRSTGLEPPAQWCQAFCYYVHDQAAKKLGGATTCPKTARCSTGWHRAVRDGLWTWTPEDGGTPDIMGGEIFMRVRGGLPRSGGEANDAREAAALVRAFKNLPGHAEVVTHIEGRRLKTVGGNTSGGGSATGDGVYRRWIDLDDPRLVGVYRPGPRG